MQKQDIFIGRRHELNLIQDMLSDSTGAKHVLPILGLGGIGKTWLFREIYNRYQDNPDVLIIQLDYTEARNQNIAHLMWSIVKRLDVPASQQIRLRSRLADLQQMAGIGGDFDSEKVKAEERSISFFFVELISQASKGKRLLILHDTVECIQSSKFSQQLAQVTALLSNAVMVFAGRPLENVKEMYLNAREIYLADEWSVHPIHKIKAFSKHEADEYFDESLSDSIPFELHKKIHFLTDGRPVLIAIAAEWLKRDVDLPEIINKSFEELAQLDQYQLKRLQLRFEKKLIGSVQGLRKPIDLATLYLAHLDRRYAPEILQLVLEIEDNELNSLVEEIQSLVFVRKSMSSEGGLLHDEVRRLIQTHAWPVVDPRGAIRKWLTETVIKGYYEPEIERLSQLVRDEVAQGIAQKWVSPQHRTLPPIPAEDFLKWELQIECLDYHFRLSQEKGWEYLDKLITDAESYHYSYIQMDAIEQATGYLKLEALDDIRYHMRISRISRLKKEAKRALKEARKAMQAPETNPAERALALIILGKSKTDFAEKVNDYQAAFEKAIEANDPLLQAEALRFLGVTYRKQGKWSDAARTYRQALRLIDEKEEPSDYAATLNNLAFVTMLNGNPVRADSMAEKALRIRKAQSNLHGLALSYATKGRIAEAIGNYTQAVHYHRMSVDLAKSVGDDKNAAIFQTNVAAYETRAHNFERARQLLAENFDHSITSVRVRTYHQAAKVDWQEAKVLENQQKASSDKDYGQEIQAKYKSAIENAQQALKFSIEMGDENKEASVLLDLAYLTFLTEKREDKEHIERLQHILNDHGYTLEQGGLKELMGDLAYNQKDYLTAFESYLEACDLLAQYSPSSFREIFERVRAKYWDVNLGVQTLVNNLIKEKLKKTSETSLLIAFKDFDIDEFAF